MKTTLVSVVVVACLTLQLQEVNCNQVSNLNRIMSEPAKVVTRSIQPRQNPASQFNAITVINSSCTQQQFDDIFEGYPSDCDIALRALFTSTSTMAVIFQTLCLPRCNQAIAQFYSECGTENTIEVFFQFCATNSDNNRCYSVFETLITDSFRVDMACPSDRSSCPSTCQNSIITFRDNSECCVNLYNNSATFAFPFSFTADDYSLWASCSVETPGFCTNSSVNRSGSSSTTSTPQQNPASQFNAITVINSSCTQQQFDDIFEGYPSNCDIALRALFTSTSTMAVIFQTLCLPRCNQAIAQFYSECGTEDTIEVFFQFCATNSDNNRCYNVFETLITDSFRVDMACPSDRSSCPSTCQNSIIAFRDNSECCVNLYNNSATFAFPFSFTADDYSLWASCSVETPGFCTESSVSRPSSSGTNTQNPSLAGLLLLGVVMLLTL